MGFVLNNILGVILGVFASFICWWILFHRIVPKIKFSDKISVLPASLDEPLKRYRVKIQNVGRREMIDVEFKIKLRIRGLIADRQNTWKGFHIKTSEQTPFFRVTKKNSRDTFGGHIIYFNAHKNEEFKASFMPPEIIAKAEEGILNIEDLLQVGTERELLVMVFGYDKFSGTRKLFVSKNYQLSDIEIGKYEGFSLKMTKRKQGPKPNTAPQESEGTS